MGAKPSPQGGKGGHAVNEQQEAWVQAQMFDLPPARARWRWARRPVRRVYHRVTSDPDVARANELAAGLAHGVKLGLARILAQRSAEEREALRARLARRRVA